MNKSSAITGIEFRSLPQQIRRQAQQLPLLVQAQRRYLQTSAPLISNRVYWQKIVEKFETDKLNDHTLDPHVNTFLDGLVDPAKSVIEFGCGIGRAAALLESRGFRNYTGIDIAERAIEIAHSRLPNMEFEVGNILAFRAGRRFDAAIATDVLLYLSPEKQIKALINMRKSLKDRAPIILRWAPGEKGIENDVLIKPPKTVDGEKVECWVFLATEEYIQQLLDITGFSLTRPIHRDAVIINPGTEHQKSQDYFVIYAEKHQ